MVFRPLVDLYLFKARTRLSVTLLVSSLPAEILREIERVGPGTIGISRAIEPSSSVSVVYGPELLFLERTSHEALVRVLRYPR